MAHDHYKERILLSVLGELGDADQRVLDVHLAECAECRAEFEETRSFAALVVETAAVRPSDDALGDARRRLRDALSKTGALPFGAKSRSGAGSHAGAGWLSLLFSGKRVAFAGAAALVVGFVAGYIVFGRGIDSGKQVTVAPQPGGKAQVQSESGGTVYRNVRLADVDPRTNEVELVYDVVRPARLKAAMDDARVRNILAQAVMNDENAGARLQAINTIGTYSGAPQGEEIKMALIRAAKTDANAGVRKQALYVLYRMPFDEDIKRACIDVLTNDENEGLRIAAINMLAVAMLEGHLEGQEIVDAVGARLQKDPNDYIRIQSEAFIQEVSSNVQ
jgi:hypothetical protein